MTPTSQPCESWTDGPPEVEDDEEEEDEEEDVDEGDVVEGVRRTLLERGRLAGPGFLWTSPSIVTSCGGPEAARNRVQAATGAQRIPPVSSAATPTASGPPPACLVSLSATGVDRKIVGSVAGVQSDAVVRGAPPLLLCYFLLLRRFPRLRSAPSGSSVAPSVPSVAPAALRTVSLVSVDAFSGCMYPHRCMGCTTVPMRA